MNCVKQPGIGALNYRLGPQVIKFLFLSPIKWHCFEIYWQIDLSCYRQKPFGFVP